MATIQDQLAWEKTMATLGVDRYLSSVHKAQTDVDGKPRYNEANTTYGQALIKEFVMPFANHMEDFVATYFGQPSRGPKQHALVMLKELDIPTCCYITLKHVMDGITRTRRYVSVAIEIGRKIEDNLRMMRFELHSKKYYAAVIDSQKKAGTTNYRHIRNALNACEKKVEGLEPWVDWSDALHLHLGGCLLEQFGVQSGIVCFPTDGQCGVYVEPTDKAEALIRGNVNVMAHLFPEYMPCLIKPRDWEGYDFGGYYTPGLFRNLPLVKTHTKAHRDLLNNTKMPRVLKAVNALQATAFRVNKTVLEQAGRLFNERAVNVVGIPNNEPLVPAPCPVDPLIIESYKAKMAVVRNRVAKSNRAIKKENDLLPREEWAAMVPYPKPETYLTKVEYSAMLEFLNWKSKAALVYKANKDRRAELLDFERVMRVSRLLADKDEFYYVYRLDSRGRVYAVGTGLNPQGSKLAKGILEFANGERLGETGFYWLCVHTANVFGKDKLTLNMRVQWVRDNMGWITKCGSNPFENEGWTEADEPFEFLKCCIELANVAVMHKAIGDRAYQAFKSRICPAMDGTCNGLQHYSMMLRDSVGARAVNLSKSDEPNDIYRDVATKVIAALTGQLTDDDFMTATYARNWLDYGIDRDLAKKPVMVLPYGGTHLGRIECLCDTVNGESAERIATLGEDEEYKKIDKDGNEVKAYRYGVKASCTMLGTTMSDAIAETVPSALAGMAFIQKVASTVARGYSANLTKKERIERAEAGDESVLGNEVYYHVPLTNFPVHMKPAVASESRIRTSLLGGTCFQLSKPTKWVDSSKVRTSSAPNFVHSMDAAHLMLTVCQGVDAGVKNFRVIHDSYGTTCQDTMLLHKCIRASFLALHRENVLEKFLMEQEERHPWFAEMTYDGKKKGPSFADHLGTLYGDFNQEDVRTSPYLFH